MWSRTAHCRVGGMLASSRAKEDVVEVGHRRLHEAVQVTEM